MDPQSQTETIELPTKETGPFPVKEPVLSEQTRDNAPPEIKWLYLKLISSGFSFFVAGINDGSLGSLIPYVLRSYHIGTNLVVVIYGVTFLGWLIAAVTNSSICQYLGLGSILALGAALQVIAHALRAWLPPFALYTATFFLVTLGQAYNDTHANTYVSSVNAAHRWLGFIHAMYMAGCLVGPFVSTAVASANVDSRWYLFYLFPLGLGLVNLVLILIAFRDRMKVEPSFGHARHHAGSVDSSGNGDVEPKGKRAIQEIKETLSAPSVWLLSLFFFFFLGAAITSGGWVVEYLVKVRDGDLQDMGYVPTGLYGGAFLGRLVLAEPTYRLGERRMVLIYALLCVGLQLVFWLVPNIIAAAIAISLVGFFSGPFFATGISVGSKIFRAEIRSSAIAFVFVLGQIGGALFPALTGVIAARAGVSVLQPIVVALLCATGISWAILPKASGLHRE
ncbi:hypothetical protein AJ79_02701 [Helicocarpus griseus UAMH5409]|uniref:Major facilitator superfamily (MFS) profile domain-containing protein n=1 Tax=Helicocarpus griseus UAMH5409 TaxID=1447875 RepID=A0A2B7Y1I5_9EURO|nr:hypothetical protein AJ79_02701 [Helicocarpus griseus UAMH5409]